MRRPSTRILWIRPGSYGPRSRRKPLRHLRLPRQEARMSNRSNTRNVCAAWLFLLLVSALSGCTACRLLSPGVPPELKHSWEVNFNHGDAAAVTALYAPD